MAGIAREGPGVRVRPASILTPPDLGRMCFRWPGEPPDGRYALLIRRFWGSDDEEHAYEAAVHDHPREVDVQADEIESTTAYIQRIAQIASASILAAPAKSFPRPHRMNQTYTGPRPEVKQDGLTFEDRLDEIYERQPGEEG